MLSSFEQFQQEALCHKEALMAHALRLTRNERDAEDLMQDTLMRAFTKFEKFEHGTNCKAWLCRIMTNVFISQYRHSHRERMCVDRSEELDENRPDTSDVYYDDALYQEESEDFSDEVSYALKNVPEDFRAIVIMADLQEQSYKEIADQLSIPIGTVMSRLYRGRQILRKKLREYAASLGIIRI